MFSDNKSPEKADLETAVDSLSSDLAILVKLIEANSSYTSEESADELSSWRESCLISLHRLKDTVSAHHGTLTIPERAKIVFVVARFTGQDAFIDERSRAVADSCLGLLQPLDRSAASCVLFDYMKPIFQSSTHPGVRQDTGRVKRNPLDIQNMFDEQSWKTRGVGSWNVLTWILLRLESESIESLWPSIIPPLLTIVEDYDPRYKLKGIMVTDALLQKVSAPLLRRTGIDELLFRALQNAMQNLTSDQSPNLLRAALPCYITLVDLVLPDDTAPRFDKLCQLVTDVIVSGWLYASSRLELMIASVELLNRVVEVLGVASARFLKAFVPQLAENLMPKEHSPLEPTLALRTASSKCLLTLMTNTRSRIPHWRHRILDAILRCWVDINDRPESGDNNLRQLLFELFAELVLSSGDLLAQELSALQEMNASMFLEFLKLQDTRT